MEGHNDPDLTADIVKVHGPCLECLDERNEAVLLPLTRRALIFEVSEEYPGDFPLCELHGVVDL